MCVCVCVRVCVLSFNIIVVVVAAAAAAAAAVAVAAAVATSFLEFLELIIARQRPEQKKERKRGRRLERGNDRVANVNDSINRLGAAGVGYRRGRGK